MVRDCALRNRNIAIANCAKNGFDFSTINGTIAFEECVVKQIAEMYDEEAIKIFFWIFIALIISLLFCTCICISTKYLRNKKPVLPTINPIYVEKAKELLTHNPC